MLTLPALIQFLASTLVAPSSDAGKAFNSNAISPNNNCTSPDIPCVRVFWPVGDSDDWVETEQAVKDFGISRYRITRDPPTPIYFPYMLEFTNTKLGLFRFFDQTSDNYTVPTYDKCDNAVAYNSKSGNIIQVNLENY